MNDHKILQEDYNKLRTLNNKNEIKINQLKESIESLNGEID